MPAILFEKRHEVDGWSFVLEHAADAFFRQDGIVLVDPDVLDLLQEAGIPYQTVNGEKRRAQGKKRSKKALQKKTSD